MIPILFLLIATGFEDVCQWLGRGRLRWVGAAVIAASLLPGAWLRLGSINWALEPQRSVSLALAKAGRLPNVQGVAVYGLPDWECGNYFFLRLNVPYIAQDANGRAELLDHARWRDGSINFLITETKNVSTFPMLSAEEVDHVGNWGIYRIKLPHERRQTVASLQAATPTSK